MLVAIKTRIVRQRDGYNAEATMRVQETLRPVRFTDAFSCRGVLLYIDGAGMVELVMEPRAANALGAALIGAAAAAREAITEDSGT